MKCTHVARQVRDIEASIAFHDRFCGMRVVHERTSADQRIVWLGWGEDPPKFVIVLLEAEYEVNKQPPWQHVGMSVDSRDEVDAIHSRAVADGLTGLWPPEDAGPIVVYNYAVPDPAVTRVESSFVHLIG